MSELDVLRTHSLLIKKTRGNFSTELLSLQKLSALFRKHFGEKNGIDLVLPKHDIHEPIDIK